MPTVEEKFYTVEKNLLGNAMLVTAKSLVIRFNELIIGKKSNSKTISMIFDGGRAYKRLY
jgi:hypothetical protein